MKPIYLPFLTLLASTATAIGPLADVTAANTKCKLTGSDTVICRSCPSLDCKNMGSMKPGNYVNVDCMCHGQKQGGSE